MKVYVERLRDDIELPEYKNIGDAGMDVRAAENVFVHNEETVIIPTGIKVAISPGYEIQIRPRSGLSYKTSLRIANAPGTIDAGYRDEIGVIVTNIDPVRDPDCVEGYYIYRGDRIAQLILKQVEQIEWEEVDNINAIEGDRGGGFGSTGTK
jgi:dUTP pyrophosphatase